MTEYRRTAGGAGAWQLPLVETDAWRAFRQRQDSRPSQSIYDMYTFEYSFLPPFNDVTARRSAWCKCLAHPANQKLRLRSILWKVHRIGVLLC